MAHNLKNSSQYYNTPVNNWYLDILVPADVPSSEFDNFITIPPKYNQRPDLLSQDQYGTPRLWWVFAVRNPDILIDPINDFVAGTTIFVPTNILQS